MKWSPSISIVIDNKSNINNSIPSTSTLNHVWKDAFERSDNFIPLMWITILQIKNTHICIFFGKSIEVAQEETKKYKYL